MKNDDTLAGCLALVLIWAVVLGSALLFWGFVIWAVVQGLRSLGLGA